MTTRTDEFNPDQPRDENGKWATTGSGGAMKSKAGGHYTTEAGANGRRAAYFNHASSSRRTKVGEFASEKEARAAAERHNAPREAAAKRETERRQARAATQVSQALEQRRQAEVAQKVREGAEARKAAARRERERTPLLNEQAAREERQRVARAHGFSDYNGGRGVGRAEPERPRYNAGRPIVFPGGRK